jgi:hypothetical protein
MFQWWVIIIPYTETKENEMVWNVLQPYPFNGERRWLVIDTVQMDASLDAGAVKKALIKDGFPGNIEVQKG